MKKFYEPFIKNNLVKSSLVGAALFFGFTSCQNDLTDLIESEAISLMQSASTYVNADANASYDYAPKEAELLATGWKKLFEENFNSNDDTDIVTTLSNWNIWTGGSFNNELQFYQAPNLQVTEGNLIITAKQEDITGPTYHVDSTPKNFKYTSARIESKLLFSANSTTPKVRMVARIKLPKGYGMWPAFWTYGDPWPTQGEIDILEARGQEPYEYQTNYFYGKEPNKNLVKEQGGFITADENLQEGYHIYEMVWQKNTLTSYLDGKLVETKRDGYIPNLFNKKEKITLNLAVGGNYFLNLDPNQIQTGTVDGITYGTMYVDWVKVFTSK